ncbi:hypothetical protein B0J11DRAFT_191030 [Dendryphion nanum]|uniref:Uncharacterized protein n=1 Tax=Dendryphion nanum TaxID=256645 RepID=A0A9P9D3M2_9PLEO|nr:hypothetical protein B0J11DRAFT_191030 [Dendryphion nanum]
MQLKAIVTLFALTLSACVSAIPAAAPNEDVEARATRLNWTARRDGEQCRIDWSGVCYEHCVTDGTSPSRRCTRSTIKSDIKRDDCGIFESKCKCTCTRP